MNRVDYESIKYEAFKVALLIMFILTLIKVLKNEFVDILE
jgi:hypothetical protein